MVSWAFFKFPAQQGVGEAGLKLASAVPSLLEFVAVSKWGEKINSVPQIAGRRISLHALTDRCSLPTACPVSPLLPASPSPLLHMLSTLPPSISPLPLLNTHPSQPPPPSLAGYRSSPYLSPSCLFPPPLLYFGRGASECARFKL